MSEPGDAREQAAAEKGYRSQKVFAVAERDVPPEQNKGALTAKTQLGEPTRWPYHVAPILRVTVNYDEWLVVIDPALPLGGPATIPQWMAAIGAARFTNVGLSAMQQMLEAHDERQTNTPNEDKTILPTGRAPIWVRTPSNVYDFMTLDPQSPQEEGESRFLTEGAPELERHHAIVVAKQAVLRAIAARDVKQTLDALDQLARPERMRLLDADRFVDYLRAQFGQAFETVIARFTQHD